MNSKSNSEVSLLTTFIDQAFDHKSWHGTNLRGSIRGVNASVAAWRPSPGRHNIWEIVVHAAYWKYIVRRRLLNERRGSFALKGSNWFERQDTDEAKWTSDINLLIETHMSLKSAIANLSPGEINYKSSNSKITNLELITGIAAHDLYHAGQIQLLKRLQTGESS